MYISIEYRPELRDVTESVTAAVLVSAITNLYERNGDKPFMMFKEPCDHPLYNPGESWTEVLHFTKGEFDGAIKRIATKVTRGTSKKDLRQIGEMETVEELAKRLVMYWTTNSRTTWYELNIPVCEKLGLYEPSYEEVVYDDKEIEYAEGDQE